ncbi:MAG: hypothetical protein CEN89_241 [Candidatus Berkelbacteria bacterium Licking1014_7]|uniref:Uncharacterized protein n=1 Tax=Candidatus Berkelbacteria bacterium Licking1014_7 TaxID=2017147 RepID=A0A554LJR9_9BACT|nr:MAG: hypothetical protein CEN89_241 [Candidatus Berkelbacteria bacterium Licking1014_7]
MSNQDELGEQASGPEMMSDEKREKMQLKITELGSLLHDEWRAPRKQEDGTFEPRIKSTKDQAWVEKSGTDQVDIANTSYEDLPEDWKGENKASAEVSMSSVYETVSQRKTA